MSAIPANSLVNVIPSVLPAGGNALDMVGLILTKNTRVPIGTLAAFPNGLAVSNYFGATSQESTIANGGPNEGTGYFGGYTNATAVPGQMLVAQYPLNAVSAYVRGGNISALLLATLQTYSGTLSVTIDSVLKTNTVNLASATSFSNAAEIIQTALAIEGVETAQVTASIAGTVMTVTGVTSGALAVGDVLTGTDVTTGTYIASFGTGTGGDGTYNVSVSQAVSSTTITSFAPGCYYDSVSGAFVIQSGTTGVDSTITYGSGALATNLLLTQATGAVLSQGSAATTPAAFMNALVQVNSNWATFMTAFDPDSGSGNTQKQAFSAWKNGALGGNRFGYVCWDTDVTPTETVPATSSLGYILTNDEDSGTCLLWEGSDLNHAAFVCGTAAAINFEATNGRITFAYKGQAGLLASVTDSTTANNLISNAYNFVGNYAAPQENFVWLQEGTVTGPFTWFDSYINQIWLNNSFQIALLTLLQNSNSVPYDSAGQALIEQALTAPIAAGLNFGAYAPGSISPAQIQSVNNAAGANVATALQAQGYYLQVLSATSAVRAARTTPPINFWFLDRGSVQKISMASIEVQ